MVTGPSRWRPTRLSSRPAPPEPTERDLTGNRGCVVITSAIVANQRQRHVTNAVVWYQQGINWTVTGLRERPPTIEKTGHHPARSPPGRRQWWLIRKGPGAVPVPGL